MTVCPIGPRSNSAYSTLGPVVWRAVTHIVASVLAALAYEGEAGSDRHTSRLVPGLSNVDEMQEVRFEDIVAGDVVCVSGGMYD